mmetsp:Transcript_10951/g.14466  ORF Transcript_10951/g.14466 Transcript_10951/m.14466 type:complete len:80 (+) Transcript_10951:46-285(+)
MTALCPWSVGNQQQASKRLLVVEEEATGESPVPGLINTRDDAYPTYSIIPPNSKYARCFASDFWKLNQTSYANYYIKSQ